MSDLVPESGAQRLNTPAEAGHVAVRAVAKVTNEWQ